MENGNEINGNLPIDPDDGVPLYLSEAMMEAVAGPKLIEENTRLQKALKDANFRTILVGILGISLIAGSTAILVITNQKKNAELDTAAGHNKEEVARYKRALQVVVDERDGYQELFKFAKLHAGWLEECAVKGTGSQRSRCVSDAKKYFAKRVNSKIIDFNRRHQQR
ncbi:hypothetical protein ACFL3T_03895 [Patescibacteria group bacterium]